jgi:release factor glutamine methyltransferase
VDLLTLPGVFPPISDSRLLARLARAQPIGPASEVLDVCTGSGIVALAAASTGARTTAVDVSRRAVATVRLNARRHGLRVQARRGRSYGPVAGQRFDLITSNPPYVPSSSTELPTRGPSRAWEAGPDGRVVLDELCDGALDHLRPGGAILLVHSSLIGEEATVRRLEAAGLQQVEVVARERGPLGPLMLARQRAGGVPPDVDEEDVVVVRGRAPR